MQNKLATLLLPGMTLNGTIFPPLPEPSRAEDFCRFVVSPTGDLPGHPRGPMGHHLSELTGRLRAWPAWNHAERRIAIGHSFGGMLLLQWILSEPDVPVDGAILIATTAGPMFGAVRMRVGGVRIPIAPFIHWWNHPTTTRFMKRVIGGGLDSNSHVDFSTLADTSDPAVDRAGWKNTDWRAMRSFRHAMQGFDVRDQLHRITIPVTVIHGTRDTLFPVSEPRSLAAGLPHAETQLVEGAGHALPLTHGTIVQEAHARLVARLGEGRP